MENERWVAIYTRVSTDEQAEHGTSIENQKQRLEAYCFSQGWKNYRFYTDDGFTGTNLDRPHLQRMLKHIREGKISRVLVYKLDRLSRSQKDVLQLLEDVFLVNNCDFNSATENFDTSSSLGRAMIGILAVFAQLERDTIIERTTSGRRQRIREGKWYGGRVPFGYNWNLKSKKLEVNDEQAELYKLAVSMYLQGHSRMHIAEILQSKTRDRVFDHSVIRDMLSRPIYAGLLPTHDGNVVDGLHDGLIDLETWAKIQEESRRRSGTRPTTNIEKSYLLSGLLECGLCGSPMYKFTRKTTTNGKSYSYDLYACVNQHVRNKDKTTHCKQGYKNVNKLDEHVVETLKQLSLSQDLVKKEYLKLIDPSENDEKLKERLIKKINEIERKLERWYTAFEEGQLDPTKLAERVKELEQDKYDALTHLEDIDSKTINNNTIKDIYETIDKLGDLWDDMITNEKQIAIRLLLRKIVVYPDWKLEFVWKT